MAGWLGVGVKFSNEPGKAPRPRPRRQGSPWPRPFVHARHGQSRPVKSRLAGGTRQGWPSGPAPGCQWLQRPQENWSPCTPHISLRACNAMLCTMYPRVPGLDWTGLASPPLAGCNRVPRCARPLSSHQPAAPSPLCPCCSSPPRPSTFTLASACLCLCLSTVKFYTPSRPQHQPFHRHRSLSLSLLLLHPSSSIRPRFVLHA